MLQNLFMFVFYILRSFVYPLIPRRFLIKDVSKDVVLITGGGFGLGRLLAERFAKLGSKVIIWDVNEENMKVTKKMIEISGGECHTYFCDVANAAAVYKTADKVRAEIGHVTMLILNAGIVNGKKLLDLSDDQIKNCFNVNTLSHFWCIKAFLEPMLKINSGHIISIDSVSAFYGTYCLTDYCASKSASHRLQDALSSELKYSGYDNIRFTSILPYFMNTGMFSGSNSKVIKILDPVYVADESLDAILRNKNVIFLPKIFHFLRTVTMMIPYKSYFAFHQAIFGGDMMDNFVGRADKGVDLIGKHSSCDQISSSLPRRQKGQSLQ